MQRVEERLETKVVSAEAGRIVVRKHVVEEPETVSVAVTREGVDVERRPVNRPLRSGEAAVANRGLDTILLVVEERLEVRRVPYVVEEVVLRRRRVRDEQQVSEPLLKERVEIELEGEVRRHRDDGNPPRQREDKGGTNR